MAERPSLKKPVDPLLYGRGQRVRVIRLALRLSRPAFERKHQISRGTLQNWEDARFGGLGEHGARRLIAVFGQEGIECTVEWLLYGIGIDPLVKWRKQTKQIKEPQKPKINPAMQHELAYFHEQHKHVIDTIMPDDAMAPRIFANDLVAGVRQFREEILKLIGQDCIVQTEQGDVLVRRIASGDEKQGYTLACPYTHDKTKFPDLKNVVLFSAALVIWIRSAD